MTTTTDIPILCEAERGCGRRKPGGLYLTGRVRGRPCCQLPIECRVCPTCHAGIKPSRAWTWIDLRPFLSTEPPCSKRTGMDAEYRQWPKLCPLKTLDGVPERVGLLWVGEKFYPTVEDFEREAREMGVSRRIPAVPNDFVLGETLVCFAHRKAIRVPLKEANENGDLFEWRPGIFRIWRPERIEKVFASVDDVTDEEREKLEERNITPVVVVPDVKGPETNGKEQNGA